MKVDKEKWQVQKSSTQEWKLICENWKRTAKYKNQNFIMFINFVWILAEVCVTVTSSKIYSSANSNKASS